MFSLFRFQRYRVFWQLRHYLRSSLFFVNKILFESGKQKEGFVEHLSIAKELSWLILKAVLMAILSVCVIKGGEYLCFTYTKISDASFIIELQKVIDNNSNTFITLFSIIASISGLFLGLYFTAISVVTSTYSRFPDNIRNLLLKEKVGTFYINLLSIATALSILMIAYKAFGGDPGIALSLFVLLLGCFGIFCFSLLGIRAFFFFDPSSFGNALFYDIIKQVKLATISGFKSFDENFQVHYQRVAAQKIKTLRTLVEICIKERHFQESSLLPVLAKTISLLEIYQKERSKIPSDSRWYNRIPIHKNWFLSDSTSFAVAMESHSFIQPEMVPNTQWFEDEIVSIFEYSLKNMLEKGSIQLASDFLNSLCGYFEKSGYDLEIQNNRKIIDKLMPIVEKYLYGLSSEKRLEHYDDEQIGLLEVWSVCIMSAPLGFYKFIREMDIKNIINRINQIDWCNPSDLYKHGFAPHILSRIEFIQKRLQFEKSIEDETITPNWYRSQLIVVRLLDIFKECTDELIASLTSIFISKSNAFIEKKLFVLAALFSKRGLETCSKMRAHFPNLEKTTNEVIKNEMVIADIPYSAIDWADIRSKISKSYNDLVEVQAKCLPTLSLIKRPKNWPDIFGQTYNTVCHEVYKFLIENDQDKFSLLFPLLFIGSIMASENLRTELKDREADVIVSIMSEPLLDLLHLSGYARIFSELYDAPKLWQDCSSVWDNYLKEREDAKPLLEKLVRLQEYRKSKFQIFPRDNLRTNWELSLKHKLREMNVIDDMLGPSYTRRLADKRHSSAFIRALCRGRYMHFLSAAEVFILTYLLKRPEASGITYQDHSDLNRNIEEEEKNEDKQSNG